MSPINRPLLRGSVRIDVRLLQTVEEFARIDEAPPPSVVAPIQARADAEFDAWRHPESDDDLCAEAEAALDGCWLNLWEVHAIQRLRGWHRARHGTITVEAYWLAAVRNILDGFTLSLGGECDTTLEEFGLDRIGPSAEPEYADWAEVRAEVLASMQSTGGCGECEWCRALRLRDQVDEILDAAGFDGGVYYRAYCLNESQAQLAERYGWKAA